MCQIRLPLLTAIPFLVAAGEGGAGKGPADLLSRVDHLVYGAPDLDRGIQVIEDLTGVRATPGGQHPGRGTRNALVALGPRVYLEIIAPDPDQPAPSEPRPFGLDGLDGPRLVTWAANAADLEGFRTAKAQDGVSLSGVGSGSRRRPDGVVLSWRMAGVSTSVGDGLVPFFIDWGSSPHPAADAARGASLTTLRAEHPDDAAVRDVLQRLGVDLPVARGPRPALIATIDTPRGPVEVR